MSELVFRLVPALGRSHFSQLEALQQAVEELRSTVGERAILDVSYATFP